MLRSVKAKLNRLYEARRAALHAEADALDTEDEGALARGLVSALSEVRAHEDLTERSFRLQVLADLLAKVAHPEATRALLGALDERDPSVAARAAAGLATVARSGRYPELVRAVEAALDDGLEGPALPGLLLDLAGDDDPVPLDVLVRLADHEDADVAAEALCALAEIGGAGVTELVSSFVADERSLSDAQDGPSTLGELAEQLVATLELEAALGREPTGEA
jgi:hypothetical protein